MAVNKKDHEDLDLGAFEADLGFEMPPFGEGNKDTKKRTPIRKISIGAAKGIGSHITSEGFIRQTVARSLPKGYDTAADAFFDTKHSLRDLYHSTASEWRKVEPAFRRAVGSAVSPLEKVLPRNFRRRIQDYAKGGPAPSAQVEDESDRLVREALAELTLDVETRHAQERAEDNAAENLRSQASLEQGNGVLKALTSINNHVAQKSAIDSQFFARAQKRSLELQYRSYFLQREAFVLQTRQASEVGEALRALVHNTALPDADKLENSERIREGVRRRIGNFASTQASEYARRYFPDAIKRAKGMATGAISGFGSLLGMGSMMSSMGDMGGMIDPQEMKASMAGEEFARSIGQYVSSRVGQGMRRSGRVAQVGASLHRAITNAPQRISQLARRQYQNPIVDALAGMGRSILNPDFAENKVIGTSPLLNMGQAGTLTRQFQRSVETVMPGYLARILHELEIQRMGKGAPLTTFNERSGTFTGAIARHRDLTHSLTSSSNAKNSASQINNLTSWMLGGANISPKARSHLSATIATMIHSGAEFNPVQVMKSVSAMDKDSGREVRGALRGRFRGAMSHGSDQTVLSQGSDMWRGAANSMHSAYSEMAGMDDAGMRQDLINSGMATLDGDGKLSVHTENYMRNLYGNLNPEDAVQYGRSTSNQLHEATPSFVDQMRDKRVDLYKQKNASGKPVIEASKVRSGAYTSLKTGTPIHFMHDVEDGVAENGRTLATASAVLGLYTNAGITFGEWLKSNARVEASDNPATRLSNAVDSRLRQAGSWLDSQIDHVTGHTRAWRPDMSPHGPVDSGRTDAAPTEAPYEPSIYSTVQPGAAHPQSDQLADMLRTVGEHIDTLHGQMDEYLQAKGTHPAAEAAARSAAATATTQKPRTTSSATPPPPPPPVPSGPFGDDGVDRLIEVLNEFKEQSAEQMDQLRESMDHLGEAAAASASGPAKKSFWQRMKDSRFGLFGRVGGKAVGGVASAAKTGARSYGSYVKTVLSFPFRGNGAFTRFVTSPFRGNPNHLGKVPADVYVGKVKVLTAGGMIAGSYVWVDAKTGKVGGYVKAPRDIKGPVMSSDLKETLISADDLKNKTVTDRLGHSLVSKGFRAAFSVVGAAGKGYAAALRLPFQALSGLASTVKGIAQRLKRPIDVYVKGEREPRLTAVGMRAGIYFLKDRPRKKVESPDDLTGEVAMMRNGEIETRISKEDYNTGLVDSRGRAIRPKVGLLANLVDKTVRGVGAAAGGFMSLLGGAMRTGGNLASIPFKMLSNLFNGRGLISIFGKNGGKVKDEGTHKLLREILNMMDHRLPENEHYRKGSWQDKLKTDKERAEKAAEGTKAAGGPSGNGLFSRLAGFFRKKKKDDDAGEDKDSSGSSVADDISAAKDAADMAKGVKDKGSRIFRRGRVLAKRGAKWLGRLGKAGAIAEGAEGLGSVASAVGSVSGIAGGAAAVGETAAAAGTAVGIAAEVGAVGAAGAAAAGGGVLAGLLAPLAIGAAALYGAYKVGQFARKEYDLHRKAPLRNYRLTQYGFDLSESGLDALKVLQLEDMLFPTVTVSGGKASFDGAKVAKMHDQIMELFGKSVHHAWYNPVGWFQHRNVDSLAEEQNLNIWLAKRFRPVFLNWVTSLKGIAPQVSLDKVDDSLTAKQKSDLLKAVSSLDPSIYNIASSPFDDLEVITGDRATQMLKIYYDAAMASVSGKDTSALGQVRAGVVAGLAAVGNTLVPAVNAAEPKDVGRKKSQEAKASDNQKLKNATVLGALNASSQVTVSTKANVQTQFAFLGGSLTALDAIRYKTYGLEGLKPDQVKAAFLLENDLYGHLSYDANDVASYEGDASFWLDQYAGYFGVSVSDVHAKIRWFNWYAKRFLPTLLAFATAVKKQNRSLQPGDASSILKPSQQLEVANAVIAATLKQGKSVVSVWTFTISPFDDHPLPTNSKICDPQLQALKNQANALPMQAPSAKPPAKGTPNAPGAKPNLTTQLSKPADQKQQIDKSLKAPPPVPASPVMVGGVAGGSTTGSVGGAPAAPVGSPVEQPGHGTGGDINKLPKVSGSGYAALKPMLDAAAKMTGVDPKVLSEIVGIESDYDPNAHAPSGTASGLGQFINSTWHAMLTKYASKYGINPQTPQTDPAANALMLGEYIHENQSYLARRLKRPPTDAEIYAAHFLGPGGASQLLKLPSSEPVAGLMPGPAQQNPTIFYQNGQAATQGQIMGYFNRRLKHFRSIVTGPAADGTDANSSGGDLQLASVDDHVSNPTPSKADAGTYKPATAVASAKPSVTPVEQPNALASANSQEGSVMDPDSRRAIADTIASKKTMEVAHQNSAIMADHAQQQTDLLKGVLEQLTLMVSHQKTTNSGIANLAKVTMGSATAIAQATTNASKGSGTPPTTASNAARGQAPLPNLPVSMSHTNYA